MRLHYIGIKNYETCTSGETLEQIKELLSTYELDLYEGDTKIPVECFFDETFKNNDLFLNAIYKDRKRRVDEKTLMASRPSFAIASTEGNKIVRLEFYEGHDQLLQAYDLKSKELAKDKYLRNSYYEKPM